MSDGGLEASLSVRRSETFHLEVSLRIPPGKTGALLGPNGAGKSTVVAALAGLLPLDSGRVVLKGRTLDDQAVFVPPEMRKVGVVFQTYLLFGHLSVIDNVAFGLRSRGVARPAAHRGAHEWLERLGLSEMSQQPVQALSGGQAQRVALARALVTDPDLLLLDEPLAALDVTTRAEARRTLAEHLADFGGPRLLITHDPTEAFLLADEIHVIEGGFISQVGTADDLRLRPRTAYAADLAGLNLLEGHARAGTVNTGGHALTIADHTMAGPVLITIRPSAIAVHRLAPEGSPRNSWATTIELVENLGDRARLRTGGPLPLTVEVTQDAVRSLGLEPRVAAWISIKATEIVVDPHFGRAGK